MDSTNEPTKTGFVDVIVGDDGDLHFFCSDQATFGTTDGGAYYHKFDVSAGTWATTDDAIATGLDNDTSSSSAVMAINSSGLLIGSYGGDPETIMGTDYNRAYLAYGSVGSWTAGVRPDGLGKLENPILMRGGRMAYPQSIPSNRLHLVYQEGGGTIVDLHLSVYRTGNSPPDFHASGKDITFTPQSSSSSTAQAYHFRLFEGLDRSGTSVMRCVYISSSGYIVTGWTDGDTPSFSTIENSFYDISPIGNSNAGHSDGSAQYYIFSQLTGPDEIWLKRTGDGDDTWTDSVDIYRGSTTINGCRALGLYDGKLGFIYEDATSGGTVWYDEYSLSAGATGTAAPTTPATTASASGTVTKTVTGTATPSTPVTQADASGTVITTVDGSVDLTTPVTQADASGTVIKTVDGSVALTAPVTQVDAVGEREITGTAALSATVVSVTAVGEREVTGTTSVTTGAVSATAVGEREVTGTATLSATVVNVSAVGEREVTGTATPSAPITQADASGNVITTVDGSVDLTTPATQVNAVGERQITGTAALSGPLVSVAAVGEREVTGTTTVTTGAVSAAAVGEREVTGTASPSTPATTAAATGERTITGTASPSAPATTASAVGERTITGTATPTIPAVTADASGTVGNVVSGGVAIQTSITEVAATGTRILTGAVAASAPPPILDASGFREAVGSSPFLPRPPLLPLRATG